jgi:hypothetical protein
MNMKKLPLFVGAAVNIHPELFHPSVLFAPAYHVEEGVAVEYEIDR